MPAPFNLINNKGMKKGKKNFAAFNTCNACSNAMKFENIFFTTSNKKKFIFLQ